MIKKNALLKPVIVGLLLIIAVIPALAQPEHFAFTTTDANHSIIVSYAAINQIELENGDEIGVFTPDGICAGAGVWSDETFGIAAWADDDQTQDVEGFTDGEELEFRIWDSSTGFEWIAEVLYSTGPVDWEVDGITSVGLNANDDGMDLGEPTAFVDIIHFGTVGPIEEDEWVNGARIWNIGEGTLAVTGWNDDGLPLTTDQEFPLYISSKRDAVIRLNFDGSVAMDGTITIETNNGDIDIDVIADVHPDDSPTHYSPPVPTGTDHSVYVESGTFNDIPLRWGDEVVVYGADNDFLAGWGRVGMHENSVGFAVWGDDPLTQEIDGLEDDEDMVFEIWRRFEDVSADPTVTVNVGDISWTSGGITVVTLEAGDENVIGTFTYDDTDIEFQPTRVGDENLEFRTVTNTDNSGWVYFNGAGSDPDGVFNDYDIADEPSYLPPGATFLAPVKFTPLEAVMYEGTAWFDLVGESELDDQATWNVSGRGLESQVYEPTPTNSNLSLVILDIDLDGEELSEEDEIGVLTTDGIIAGGALFTGELPLGIIVYGDDAETQDVEGFTDGDTMLIRIWDNSASTEYWAVLGELQDGELTWSEDGITVVSLQGIVPPWELDLMTGQAMLENDTFSTVQLDNYITHRQTDPADIDWSVELMSDPVNNLDLIYDLDIGNRTFAVSVPDSEWVGLQVFRFFVEDEFGQTDSVDLAYEIIQVNDAPNPFNLLLPEEDDSLDEYRPTLAWEQATDVDWSGDILAYNLYYSVENLQNVVTDHEVLGLVDTTFMLPHHGDNKTITWSVEVDDGEGETTWAGPNGETGSVFYIYVQENPYEFEMLNPADDDSSEDDGAVAFTWENNGDPDPGQVTEHFMYLADNSEFTDEREFGPFADAEFITLNQNNDTLWMEDDTQWWWRVIAVDPVVPGEGTWAGPNGEEGNTFYVYIPEPPGSFDLLSPSDTDTVDIHGPILTWQSTTDPDPDNTVSYTLAWALDTDDLLNDPFLETGLTDTFYTFEEEELNEVLDDDAVIYWHVLAVDQNTEGTWSGEAENDYWSFTVYVQELPDAFSLLEIADMDSSEDDGSVYFEWENNGDPDPGQDVTYYLHIGEDVNFETDHDFGPYAEDEFPIFNEDNQAEWMTDDTQFWWKVFAQDSVQGDGVWSDETWSFRVYIPEPPVSFDLLSPLDTDTVDIYDPTLTWESTIDPDPDNTISYTLAWALDTDDLINDPFLETGLTDTFYTFEEDELNELLDDDAVIYWHVLAVDQNTEGTWSGEGENDYWSFSVYVQDLPNTFSLLEIADTDSSEDDGSVYFEWENNGDPDPGQAVSYYLHIGDDENFEIYHDFGPYAEGEFPTFNEDNQAEWMTDDTQFWWKVFAQDSVQNDGVWSDETWSFRIYIPEPPDAFDLLSPEDEEIVDTLGPTLTWESTTDPDPDDGVSYTLVWSFFEDFNETNEVELGEDTTYTFEEENLLALIRQHYNRNNELDDFLPDDQLVYWKVHAVDMNTGGTWSLTGEEDYWSFEIYVPDNPEGFSLLSPINNTVTNEVEVSLTWQSTRDPDPDNEVFYSLFIREGEGDFELEAEGLEDTTYTFDAVTDDEDYYWTVFAEDENTNGTWALDTLSFSTYFFQPPEAFALTTPGDEDSVDTTTPTVEWEEAIDPDPGDEVTYSVVWSIDDDTFTDPDSVTGIDVTSYTFEVEMLLGGVINDQGGLLPVGMETFDMQRVNRPETKKSVSDKKRSDQKNILALNDGSDRKNNPGIHDELDEFEDDVTVYWYVRAVDTNTDGTLSTQNPNDGTEISFDVYIPDPPDPFGLVSPDDGFVTNDLTVTLEWDETDDPDPDNTVAYDLYVSDDIDDLGDPVEVDLDVTTFDVDLVDDDTDYWWTVHATDLNTEGTWASDTFNVHTYIFDFPEAFNLSSPADESTVEIATPTLTWVSSSDVDPGDSLIYVLYWAFEDDFSDADSVEIDAPDTTYTFDEALMTSLRQRSSGQKKFMSVEGMSRAIGELDELPDDDTVYWKVRSQDTNTEGTWSSPDEGWSFDIYIPEPPEAFSLLAPDDGSTIDEDEIELSWEAATDPDPGDVIEYIVWWATDEDFSENLDSVTVTPTTHNLTGLLDDHTYYWKVRAQDTNSEGTWSSETFNFDVYIPDLPADFALAGPENGTVMEEEEVTVWWTQALDEDPGDTVTYTVEWSLYDDFSELFSGTTTDTFFVIDDVGDALAGLGHSSHPGKSDLMKVAVSGKTRNLSGRNNDSELDGLPDDSTVYWRVSATDIFNLTVEADPNEGWSFGVNLYDPPEAFGLVSPEDGYTSFVNSVTLEWDTTTDPDPEDEVSYVAWYATDSEFTTNLDSVEIPDTTYGLTGLLDDQTYWWKIRAQDTNTTGTWSTETYSFDVYIPELTGIVESERLDDLIIGANISLVDTAGMVFSIRTGDDGIFTFYQLPAGSYTLRVTHDDYATLVETELEITAGVTLTHDITLSDVLSMGYNLAEDYFELISFFFNPDDPSAMSLFGDINDLLLAYEDNGEVVIPPVFNTIGDIDVTEGYRLLAASSANLQVSGAPVMPDIEFTLQAETWNLMGYPFDYELPVEIALASIEDVVIEVMNDDGLLWIPDSVNTLGYLMPGEGYIVTVNEDVTFSFETGGWMIASVTGNRSPLPDFEGVTKTGLPYSVLIGFDQELQDLMPETIEIYDGSQLVGKNLVSDSQGRTLVTTWQGAPQYDIPGFTPGNPMRIVLKDLSGREITARALWGDAQFGKFPYANLTLVKDIPLPTEFVVDQAYPNPFNSTITLRFGLPGDGDVRIAVYNLLGRQVYETNRHFNAGYSRFSFKADTELVSGLYFIRVSRGDKVHTQKVILLK
ncbi:MAG: T9SS type A sorting domain-containing protein [Candidatus Electryonea clarkiae]|nr:T9SS type A sorting domain-containing protein [Candidatus Electryonea clarkiae]MDP8287984.1 T9SS type A sorting domain-containing protein [Candidatus Electryonea clarkiae]